MKCVICKHGETRPGRTVVTLSRRGTTVVFRDVPAQVCAECGEAYVDAAVGSDLLRRAGAAEHAGIDVGVQSFREAG